MENVIVCNTAKDSLSRIQMDNISVDTLPLKLGGEKIGPRSIDVKEERGIVANCYSDSITFINIKEFKEEENFSVGRYPKDVKWVDDYAYVACGESNSLVYFNTKTKEIDYEIKVGDYPSSIAIDKDKRYIYVANINSNSISIIENKERKVEKEIFLRDMPTKIKLSNDGKNIYVCENSFGENMKGSLKVYSLEGFLLKEEFEVGAFPMDIVEVEETVYVTNFAEGTISVIDLKSKGKYKLVIGGMPKSLLKTEDRIIVSDYYKGRVIVIDEKTMNKKIIAVGNEPNAMISTNFLH